MTTLHARGDTRGVNAGANGIPFCRDINLSQEPRRRMKEGEEATVHTTFKTEDESKRRCKVKIHVSGLIGCDRTVLFAALSHGSMFGFGSASWQLRRMICGWLGLLKARISFGNKMPNSWPSVQ